MSKQLDPRISEVLKQYGFDKDAVWNCHGTWVVLHKVLEQIAAKAGVKYERPEILVAEREAAAVLVTGSIGEASEWSIGEAVIGLNYKVKNNQPGYPFAMAEKRAKDRVILKLIGLHGLAYSEEEADDFKASKPEPQQQADMRPPIEKKWLAERKGGVRMADNDSERILNTLLEAVDLASNPDDMKQFAADNQENIGFLIDPHYLKLKHAVVARQNANYGQRTAANG